MLFIEFYQVIIVRNVKDIVYIKVERNILECVKVC